ncbi:hypothetical protein GS503_01940 [Rhodococcus hoagii]|nr:hypothetical protein [Prescottella equi]
MATAAAVVTAHSSASDSSERLVQGYSVAIMVTAIIAALVAVLAVAARAADTNSTEVEKTTKGDL